MIELDIVERLRGKVRIPVNDGAGLLDGKDFFERQFPASKSAMEAADEIERLRNELAKCGKENCMGHEIEGHALWVRKERLDDALKQLVKCRSDLEEYGQHTVHCDYDRPSDPTCTCGFTKALVSALTDDLQKGE